MAVGDIVVRVRGDSTGYRTALSRARNQTRQFRSSVEAGNRRVAASYQNVEREVFRLRARMVGLRAVAGGVFSVMGGGGIIRYADQWKLTTSRIASVTGSLSSAKDEMQDLLALANRSRGSIETLANSYSKLRLSRNDLGREETFSMIETLQKSLIIGGNTPQEVRSVALQLTQGIAADQLGGEELRTIRESGFYFQKILAEGLGVQVGELKQLGAESKLTARAVTDAIVSMADRVDEEFDKIPLTVSQATTKLTNNFREWIGGADEASGATSVLAGGISALADNFAPIADGGLIAAAAAGALLLSRNVGAAGISMVRATASAVSYQVGLRKVGRDAQFASRLALAQAQADGAAARSAAQTAMAQYAAAASVKERARSQTVLKKSTQAIIAADRKAALAARALSVANGQASVTMRAGALAATGLRSALAFVGGPIGAAVLAVAAGFALWADNARKAERETRLLGEATDRIASASLNIDSEDYIQTADIQKRNLEQLQGTIDTLNESIDAGERRLKELQSVGRDRIVWEGSLGTQRRTVPGRPLNSDELAETASLEGEIAQRRGELLEASRLLRKVEEDTVLSLDEYNRRRRAANKLDANGSEAKSKLAKSMGDLNARVNRARFNLESFGASGDKLTKLLIQAEVNKLIADGVKVTNEIRSEVAARVTQEQALKAELDRVRDAEKERAKLLSDAKSAVKSLRTPLEEYQDSLARIASFQKHNPEIFTSVHAERARAEAAKEYADELERARVAAGGVAKLTASDARSFADNFLSPLEKYNLALKKAADLRENFPDIVSDVTLERARVSAAEDYAKAIKKAGEEQTRLASNLANAVTRAKSFKDILGSMGRVMQEHLADKYLTKPLTGFFDKVLSASDNGPTDQVKAFAKSVSAADNKLKTGFISSVASSVTSLFTKTAADTTAATAAVTEATARSVNITAILTSTAALAGFTASLGAASAVAGIKSSVGAVLPFGGFRAKGGPAMVGNAYVVGEEGPEWFVPNTSGRVISNKDAYGGSLGGSSRIVIDVGAGPEFAPTVRQIAGPQSLQIATNVVGRSMASARQSQISAESRRLA